MTVFNPTITQQGLAAAFNAEATGTELVLTHMAYGTAAYDPVGDEIALKAEVKRVAIGGGQHIADNQIRISSIWESDTDRADISEIGFYADSILFAVISRSTGGPFLYKTPGSNLIFSYDWVLNLIPVGSITFLVDPDAMALLGHMNDPNAHAQYLTIAEFQQRDSKNSVRVATTANIASLSGLLVVDGVTTVVGDRVLVKNQSSAFQNGIYVVASGAWYRAPDADSNAKSSSGYSAPVEEGTANSNTIWQLTTNNPIALGTTNLVFEVVSGPSGVEAGTFTQVTVDSRGRVVDGANPTTLDGYGITDALDKAENLGDLPDVVEARDNLGLGSAATADVQTDLDDTTAGALMKVGAFGLGGAGISLAAGTDLDTVRTSGIYRIEGTPTHGPSGLTNSVMIVGVGRDVTSQLIIAFNTGELHTRGGNGSGSTWSPWKKQWDSGSLVKQSSAWDATAGRVLTNGAFGLGGKAPELPGDDFNAAQVGGTYTFVDGTLNRPNVPNGSTHGTVIHAERSFGNLAYQEVHIANSAALYRYRNGDSATGIWDDWQTLWDSSNLEKQTSNGDSAAGRVLTVGAFGLGGQGLEIADGADLNTFLLSGFYRINNTPANGPPGVLHSPMLVVRSSDTVAQIAVNYSTGLMWSRSAVLGTPTWTPWESHWTSGNLVKQSYPADDTSGSVLLTGAYGLGHGGIMVEDGTNIDSLGAFGVYRVNTGPNVPNSAQYTTLLVMQGQDVSTQLMIANDTGIVHSRGYVTGVGWGSWSVGWSNKNFDPDSKQAALGFTPVQQGTGTGHNPGAVVKIGYRNATNDVGLQIDTSDYGALWVDTNGIGKVAWAVSTFGAGTVGSYGIFKAYNAVGTSPGTEVAGVNLQYTDTGGQSALGNPAGTWRLMGGLENADGAGNDSVSIFLRVL